MDGSSDGRNGSAAARGGRLLPAAVFVVMVVVAAVAFATVHSTVNDQNRRALDERTREVGLLLKTAITGLSSSMQPLGVAARFGGTQAFSREAAAHTATAKTQAVALVRRTGGRVHVVAAAGLPLLAAGRPVTGAPARAVAAALASRKLTATPVFHSGPARLLAFVLGPPTTAPGTAVLLEVPIDPTATARRGVTQKQAFNELDVTLYASRRADPAQLVLQTSMSGQRGHVAHDFVPVGAGRWLLAASARSPLVGSFAEMVPWIVLGVGGFGAVIATAAVAVFQRRRDYALALVDTRTAELNSSLEELGEAQARLVFQERLAAIGQVAAAVGHELRNPLGVLTNSLYLIRAGLPAEHRERLSRHLATAEREIGASVVIVEGLLDFARERDPDPALVDLPDLVDESLSVAPPPPDVQVVRRGLDELPALRADRQQLRQVLLNLVSNAYAAMDGRGTLTISGRARGDGLELRVSDTGTGMDEDTANHIFDPFFTRRAKGIGLGLAVTKRIVEAHGGTIAATSTLGAGATFEISLPGALVAAEQVRS